jgi:predicted AAA+ superfamily ATPase
MDEATIIEILKKWNPWERKLDSGVKRSDYIKKIYPYFERKEVLVLKGIRRSGKSTILKQLINELIIDHVDKKQILYVNLDDYNFANDLRISLFDDILDAYVKYSGNKNRVYFFFDEVQKIEGWEKWVRTKYDLNENIKFIVSGSTASLLSKELSALLTGRNLSFKIMPLSFKEFKEFRKGGLLEEYLKFGGFPEVVLEKSEDKKLFILRQYFEDIIHKDIVDRYNVRNAKQLLELARYFVSASGSKASFNKLSNVFGLSNDTLALYVSYMIDAYLLFEVTYFSFSAKIKHDVTKLSKLYALDNGLINVVSVKYSESLGQMFENTVLVRLVESFDEVSYWSELKSEVDFIVGRTAINVTATDEIPDREFQGLKDFSKKHKNFSFLLVTPSTKNKGVTPLSDFLIKGIF